MKIIKGLFFFILLSIVLISVISTTGCANIVPPSGGPKDTLPPVLMSAIPRDSMLKFTGKTITFTFDEYVLLKEKEQNVIVNPTPKTTPTIESKLKVVSVKLRDSLEPNTTYTINFGRAIRDVDEENVLKNFTYVFSTGSYIDSLTFSGRVIVARTGKVDTTIIVMLHRRLDDSAVANERPRYVTRIDSTGSFTFRYLAPGTYAVYALKDEGGSRSYSSKSQLFAFADTPVVIRANTYTPPVSLFAYVEDDSKPVAKKSSSSGTAVPPPKLAPEKNKRLQFQNNIKGGEFDILDTLKFQFAARLKYFDSTQFRFTDDQFNDIAKAKYRLIMDSTSKNLTLLYVWALDTKYYILANKEFAEDSLGRKLLKNDTIAFHTKRESEYGEVTLRFFNLDLSKNPVLQFIQSEGVKFSYPFKSRTFSAKLFPPGEYELRILYDDNKNGVWDPGNFFNNHKQPEKVQPIKMPKSKHRLTVKANWDNDIDFTL